jgi:MFS family permease
MMILARMRPSYYVPLLVFLWGVVTAAVAAITTYPQLLVMRLLVGVLEAGLTPGVTFIFSNWYLPDELGKRMSIFMTSAQLGGAFGGIIAGGVMENLEGARGIRGWRWLFIVEGAVTCFVAVVGVFVLPDYPAVSRKITEAERSIALRRLEVARIKHQEREKTPRLGALRTIRIAFSNWRTWVIPIAFLVCPTLHSAPICLESGLTLTWL